MEPVGRAPGLIMVQVAYDHVVEVVSRTRLKDLPGDVRKAVDTAMLDTLGVNLAGTIEPAARIIADYGRRMAAPSGAGVFCAGYRSGAELAALVNGTALHALDFDDTGAYSQGHPSATIFPAVLALAEERGSSMEDVASAYVVGVEVLSRFARSMPMMHMKGWHPTAVLGTIASAAACSNLLGLDPLAVRNAIAIAATQAGGLVRSFGSMAKPLHVGQAASLGVRAACLAEAGFTGCADIIFGEHGFLRNFHGDVDERARVQFASAGAPWAIIEPGVNIKRYPCCSLTHRAIDALLDIVMERAIAPEMMARIDCRVPPRAIKVLSYTRPVSGLQAKFSMQFVLACALINRHLAPAHFEDQLVNSTHIGQVMERIDVRVHEDWKDGDDARPDVVVIHMKDGTFFRKEVAVPKGNASRPLAHEDLVLKFKSCAEPVIGTSGVSACLNWFDRPFEQRLIKELIDIVTPIHHH